MNNRDIKLHALSQSLLIKDKRHNGEKLYLFAAENKFSSESHYELPFLWKWPSRTKGSLLLSIPVMHFYDVPYQMANGRDLWETEGKANKDRQRKR